MAECELVPNDDDRRWGLALEGMQTVFGHGIEAARAFSASTGARTFLCVLRAPGFRTVCALAERSFGGRVDVFTMPGFSGFATLGTLPAFEELWQQAGQAFGWVCAYVQEHPLLTSPFGEAGATRTGRVAYVLDIAQPEPDLLAGMSQSRRRQLRRPLGDGWQLARAPRVPLGFLRREADGFLDARAADRTAYLSPEGWAHTAAAADVFAIEATCGGVTEAVSLFAGSGAVADYLYNISTEAGQPCSARLIWAGIAELRARGCRALNLGGGIRPDDSIAEFKRRFGPAEIPIVTRCTIFDAPAYAALCAQAGTRADDAFFPSYHRRRS
ncbi:hypothetical protein V8J36_21120 [Frigidibacter sp. MR17.14]|uniref:hypothetical protein n=1 Tax=Frigidibacter sp. MR17.14 TaxID=3126509 RepID=UPI003012F90E